MSLRDKSIRKIKLPLGRRSYDIQIGSGAVKHLSHWLPRVKSKRAFVICDQALEQARLSTRQALSQAGWEVHEFPVTAGESLKEIAPIYALYGSLLKANAHRDSILFALGGGTIGDAAGFVAATFLRGIRWVGLPTTLLAQVDSSVGGKTGINHELGKNLIGSIYQPSLVVCDTDFLKTLSSREMVSGLGEAIKYGFIYDANLFNFIAKNTHKFLQTDPGTLSKVVTQCLKWKCKAVAKDEKDQYGVREILNFGHTFGHALETLTEYQLFQHGEAVIWGMRFALSLSQVRKHLKPNTRAFAENFLATLSIPSLPTHLRAKDYFEKMKKDKKVRDGKIHFILLRDIGKTISDAEVSESDLHLAFELLTKRGVNA